MLGVELRLKCFNNITLAEVETLKAELKKARQEVEQHEAMATRAKEARAAEKVARDKDRTWVLEVEEALKGVYVERDKLQAEDERTKEELENL